MNIIDIFTDINTAQITELRPQDPADAPSALTMLAESLWLDMGPELFLNLTVHVEFASGETATARLARDPQDLPPYHGDVDADGWPI